MAVGSICQPDCFGPASVGLVATSADGSTWAFAPVGEASALEAIASAGSRLFAVGARNQDVDLPAELQVWQSDDGLDWRRVAGVPNLRDASSYPGLDIAATEDRVVVVGWAGVGANGDLQNFAFVGSTSGPTAGPQPTASAATPPPTDPIASAIDPEVMLRVEIRPDASVGRMPSLTVYRDGSVLRRDDASGRITRLTPSGLALLLAPATESDLLAASGELGSDPAYQGGRTTYTIELRRGQEIVRRETTNSMAPATRSEAERIIALAEHLDDLESWLPEDVWATKPAAFEPFVASNYLLKVTSFKQPGVDYPAQALDRADVDWPLPGTLEGFGDLPDVEQPLGPGTTSRCGVLTLAEAAAVKRSLAAAPFVPMGERLQADLDWAPSIGHVTVSLIPLLPEDPLDCAVDLSWP